MNVEIDALEKQIYDLKAQLNAARRKVTPEPVKDWPGVSALRKTEGGAIERTGRTRFGPGDDFCALWPLFDLLEGGAGNLAAAV